MNRRTLTTVVLVVGAAIAAMLYFAFDPAESRLAPKCMFYMLTGWECPGCGSQRMLHALLHGDIGDAWKANPVVLCMLPWLGVMAVAAARRLRAPRFYAAVNSLPAIIITSSVLLAWGVFRNL